MIIVFTAPHYFKDRYKNANISSLPSQSLPRELIRRSWGSPAQLKIVNAVLIFVIGEFNSEKLQTEVLAESDRLEILP